MAGSPFIASRTAIAAANTANKAASSHLIMGPSNSELDNLMIVLPSTITNIIKKIIATIFTRLEYNIIAYIFKNVNKRMIYPIKNWIESQPKESVSLALYDQKIISTQE